jgi:hypothetical protein
VRASLSLVAFLADQPMSPRGERALAVARAAGRIAHTELIGPVGRGVSGHRARQLTRIASPLLLDRWEPEAWWILSRRRSRPDGALLMGFPFSAVYWAARWLVRVRVRYVVDLGDPWALTLPVGERMPMGRLRASRCERFVWRHAAAGVLTTQLQADALHELFPDLPLVVRPNGYRPAPASPRGAPRSGAERSRTLRLVHYGNLYTSRVPVSPLIARLAQSGRWDRVVVTQQGEDWSRVLHGLPRNARVELSPPGPWEEVVESAGNYDLAVVVGNRNPAQLPSKAVQYLTLPIPRLAIVSGERTDALASYVQGKPGWLVLSSDAPAEVAASAVAAHVQRPWTAAELLAPAQESWDSVAGSLVDVLLRHTVDAAASPSRAQAVPPPVVAAGASPPG